MDNIDFCIDYLLKYNKIKHINYLAKEDILRSLMNITMPINLSKEFYEKESLVLTERLKTKTIVDVDNLPIIENNISLYRGDITLLKADAIVNACNELLLGCFSPLHSCIDNAIHSYAGLEVRRDILAMKENVDDEFENSICVVTKSYSLPSKYIFHTIGPKAFGSITKQDEEDLKNCYLNCLKKADEMGLSSIVFCSISTGVYGYPIKGASLLAVKTVKNYLQENTSKLHVIFDVFSEGDYHEYLRNFKKTN